MARSAREVLWDQWRKRIKRQQASGLTIAEFCRREALNRQSFHLWKRKLCRPTHVRQVADHDTSSQRFGKRKAVSGQRSQSRQAAPSARAHRRAKFLQVPFASVQAPLAPMQGSPWFELVLVDGTILRLPQQNIEALLAVLRVLRGERSHQPRPRGDRDDA